MRIDGQRQVLPKGAEAPLKIFEVGGIAGGYNLALETRETGVTRLRLQIPLLYKVLGGTDPGEEQFSARAVELFQTGAKIVLGQPVSILTNFRMNLEGMTNGLETRDFCGAG